MRHSPAEEQIVQRRSGSARLADTVHGRTVQRMKSIVSLLCAAALGVGAAAVLMAPQAGASELASRSSYKVVEKRLNALGIPAGPSDGRFDSQSARAACAWRELTGRKVSRSKLSASEQTQVTGTASLDAIEKLGAGVSVNKTCQVAYWQERGKDGQLRLKGVFAASTGISGHDTPVGRYQIQRQINGWHESTKYTGAMMYRPKYFNGGIALHGSYSDDLVHSYPASHGCVRMFHKDIDTLWKAGVGVGTPVRVYGTWQG